MSTTSRVWLAGELGTFRGGSGFPIRHQGKKSGDLPFFKVSDMNSGGNELFMTRANNYISEAQRKTLGAVRMPAQAIVFAKVGAAVFQERKRILAQDSCIDNNMAAFIVDKGKLDVRFAHYLLTAFRMSDLVAVGALPSLNGRQLRSIPLLVPSDLAEQRRIVAALADADSLIATLEHLIVKKQAIKRGMMQQLLTGRTRLPGFSTSWDEVTWSDVVARQPGNGQIKGRLSSVRSVNAQYPGYSASGQDVWLPTWDIEGEGVVISAVGSRCGRSFLAAGRWSAIANTHIVLPRPDRLDASFAMLYFDNESFWIKGGSGQPFVQVKSSLSRRVDLPPLDEQRAIMRVVGDIDRNISLLEIRLSKARAIKAGMMQQLLTGRTRLPVELE